jgi:hypothetical protein
MFKKQLITVLGIVLLMAIFAASLSVQNATIEAELVGEAHDVGSEFSLERFLMNILDFQSLINSIKSLSPW